MTRNESLDSARPVLDEAHWFPDSPDQVLDDFHQVLSEAFQLLSEVHQVLSDTKRSRNVTGNRFSTLWRRL